MDVDPKWDAIRRADAAWSRLPYPTAQYPPGGKAGEVAGVDLALLHGDACAVVGVFLEPGLGGFSDEEEERLRRACLSDLERVAPMLSGAGRDYFGGLLDLLRAVDAARRRV